MKENRRVLPSTYDIRRLFIGFGVFLVHQFVGRGAL